MYEPEAGSRLARLVERGAELARAATAAAMPNQERRMREWQAHVERHHQARALSSVA
jgi:hypothetical protein